MLSVAILAVVLLSGAGGPIGRAAGDETSPSPTASAISPSSTAEPSATAPVTPGGSGDEAIRATLAEIEAEVLAIRGLAAPDIEPAELLTRAELAEELEALFEAEYPADEQERDTFVLRAFGLLGPDEDLVELQLGLLTDQVAGFYSHEDRRMVVVSDGGLDAAARLTYAHEFTHALQDEAFGLGTTLETDAVGEDDRGLARLALVEGDATVTMIAWALRHLSQEELMEIGSQQLPDTTGVPSWMVSQLLFPYVAGQEFVLSVMAAAGADALSPDFTEVDAAYATPPDSTAEIIDPRKWRQGIAPLEVDVPDLAAALGDGWEEVNASSVGQASVAIVLEHFGVPSIDAGDASEGWGGDRAVVARGPDDAFALVWRLTWDTPDDAAAFEAAYATVVEALPFPALVTRDGERDVLVAHAATTDLLRQTVAAAR